MKVFIDTNLVLDVLANRTEFYDDAAAIWSLCEPYHSTQLVDWLPLQG